jgi:putative inorganic carbon (HCO3(-)) transporter
MPMVSLKHFFAKVWFVFPLYFFPIVLFKKRMNIHKFFILYIIPLSIVIVYTINKHLSFGLFDKKAAHLVMRPFYNDHTSYGAILAMYLPVLIGLILLFRKQLLKRTIFLGLLGLFTVATVLSYTRAAWISVLGALLLLLLLSLKIKLRTILLLAGLVISILFTFRLEIIDKLDKNQQDSSTELSEHVESISNIATDASNLERINRWNSALKMFKEKPILGWGPGTYMFQYAPFQMADDKTIISTNFGDWGNAHSEYIGPLAEQGVPGLITVLLIVFTTLQTAFRLYYHTKDKLEKHLILISILSLTTYFIHGLLNNYLDTDKASVPFWGMIAIIVSIDLWKNKDKKNPQLGGAEER